MSTILNQSFLSIKELENLISMKSLPEVARPAPPLRSNSTFATTPSPLPSPNLNPPTSILPSLQDSTDRPMSPLPALPSESTPEATATSTLEVSIPITTPPKIIPVPRKSMAERLGELARRGSSSDFPSRTSSPNSNTTTTTLVKVNEVEAAVKSSELPLVPIEKEKEEMVEVEVVKDAETIQEVPKTVESIENVKVLEELEVHDEPEEVDNLQVEVKAIDEEKKVESINRVDTPTISISVPDEVLPNEVVVEKEVSEIAKVEEVKEEKEEKNEVEESEVNVSEEVKKSIEDKVEVEKLEVEKKETALDTEKEEGEELIPDEEEGTFL